MDDGTLRRSMRRQAEAVASDAAAQSCADHAAAEMGRRVRAVTAEFLVEVQKLGNPGLGRIGGDWTGWTLLPGIVHREGEQSGIALATNGCWLETSSRGEGAWHVENPETLFRGSLFSGGPSLFVYPSDALNAQHDLDSSREPHMTLQMQPYDRRTLPNKPLLVHGVDLDTLKSPAALAAHYLAALLAYTATAYPPPPPVPPPIPAPPERRRSWWRRLGV